MQLNESDSLHIESVSQNNTKWFHYVRYDIFGIYRSMQKRQKIYNFVV
jgi:hypothetical protein